MAAAFTDLARGIKEGNIKALSADLAKKYLTELLLDKDTLKRLLSLVKEEEQRDPELKMLSNILIDAKWTFWGKKSFFSKAELLFIEKKNLSTETISERTWYKDLLDKMLKHRFLTPWANKKYSKRKNKNLLKLKSMIKDFRKQDKRFKSGKDFGRGIDTAFRVALKNHTDLSRIADGKANMIISINALILSVLITGLTAGLSIDSFSESMTLTNYFPIIVLLLSSLSATAFAVYSAVPNINSIENFSKEEIEKKNMLFFGNFLSIDEGSFVNYFRKLRTDQEKLYDNLSLDLYGLGKVLRKKYRLLGISYRVFIGGLICSFFCFLMLGMP